MACKIGIKIGNVEINYEGEESFFRDELPKMISSITVLMKDKDLCLPKPEATTSSPEKNTPGNGRKVDLSVANIAKKIGQKNGPDLVLAAAGYLTFVEGIESFTRGQLWAKMKTAPSLNHASFNNNLTKYINGLVDSGLFIQNAAGKYALSPNGLAKLESALGNGS